MTKKEAKLTCVTIAQQFEPEYWIGWDENLIRSKNIEAILKEIVERASTVASVSDAYGILHDSDTLELYDAETQSYSTKSKEEHGHFLLKFSKGTTLSKLALAIGIKQQYLEKAKPGRYGYDNLLAYLIHAKDSDKFQYSPTDVITLIGEEYLEVHKERYVSWCKGRLKKDIKNASDDIEALIMDILDERVTQEEILISPKLLLLYSLYKTKIKEAFLTLGELKATRTKRALENGEFKKTILFITGKSGLGKSVFAKKLIQDIIQLASIYGQKWSHTVTAGTNIFDEVNGEEILLLDDVRGDSLTASDWLKLLDPFNISPISARYQNRMGSARVIIITSTKHPLEFFYHTKNNEREDLSQYIRRFDSLVTLYSDTPHSETRYFQTHPKRVHNLRRRLPHSEVEVYLNYDFENNSEVNEEQLLEFLLAQVSLNNQWDLDTIKTSSEDTLASNSDEENTEDSIS